MTFTSSNGSSNGSNNSNGLISANGSGIVSGLSSSYDYPIIVHCHLRWDWVWQRPQQFLSRLSRQHRILFVENPHFVGAVEVPRCLVRQVPQYPHITLLQMQFPAGHRGENEWADAALDEERRRLFEEALAGPLAGQFEGAVQWFYDPMAFPIFGDLEGVLGTVYDCMDELSQFKGTPPILVQRERELLRAADVVFTGGRKMYESKSRYNGNCHFYGCGVDIEHFGKAKAKETRVPADVQELTGPVLGYFGVIDERLDYELILKLAEANPQWNLALVGPVAKVDPNTLPERDNIYWLGSREYSQLPAYAKRFDVCLMPFALNGATEYINPTKALEYMATGREIVSSAVPDVVSNFAQVVKIAGSHEEFIELCRKAVQAPDERAIERGLRMAAQNTWELIVAKLEGHIQDALSRKPAAQPAMTGK